VTQGHYRVDMGALTKAHRSQGGMCHLCGVSLTRRAAARHLEGCAPEHDKARGPERRGWTGALRVRFRVHHSPARHRRPRAGWQHQRPDCPTACSQHAASLAVRSLRRARGQRVRTLPGLPRVRRRVPSARGLTRLRRAVVPSCRELPADGSVRLRRAGARSAAPGRAGDLTSLSPDARCTSVYTPASSRWTSIVWATGSTIQYSGTPYRANSCSLRPRSVASVDGDRISTHRSGA
jgi:hypothetical protein